MCCLILIFALGCYSRAPIEQPYNPDADPGRAAIERCVQEAVRICNTQRTRIAPMKVLIGADGAVSSVRVEGDATSMSSECVARTLIGMRVESTLARFHAL